MPALLNSILRSLLCGFMIVLLLFAHFPMRVLAIDDQQRAILDLGVNYFNWKDCAGVVQASDNTTLVGNDNAERGFNFFVNDKGLSPVQAAALIGNMMAESHMDPAIHQGGGGAGRGIVQWGVDDRWQGVLKLASDTNRSPTDLAVQLDFAWIELNGGYKSVLDKLKRLNDIQEASDLILHDYEIAGDREPGGNNSHIRGDLSRGILARYGKGAISGGGGSSGSSGNAASQVSNQAGGSTDANGLPTVDTEEKKIAQTMMIGIQPDQADEAAAAVKKYQLGGVFVLGSSSSVVSTFDKAYFDKLNKSVPIPLFTASDEEGKSNSGGVQRYDAKMGLVGDAKQMGGMSDSKVKDIGQRIGKGLTEVGVNMDLAPVVDLDNGNAMSDMRRAYSANPDTVAAKANAFAQGLQAAKVVPVLKHFPGFGNTRGNTDNGPVTISGTYDLKNNIAPYKKIGNDNNAAVMMSNIVVPNTDGKPASISPEAVKILTGQAGFSGLITTDDLSVLDKQGTNLTDSIVGSLKAGVDMPLFIFNGDSSIQQAIDAAKKAKLGNRLDDAVRAVLDAKQKAGIITKPTVDTGCSQDNTGSNTNAGGCTKAETILKVPQGGKGMNMCWISQIDSRLGTTGSYDWGVCGCYPTSVIILRSSFEDKFDEMVKQKDKIQQGIAAVGGVAGGCSAKIPPGLDYLKQQGYEVKQIVPWGGTTTDASLDQIRNLLGQGYAFVVRSKTSVDSAGTTGTTGHYFVLYGVSADGQNFYFANPGARADNNKAVPASRVKSWLNGTWAVKLTATPT